MERAQEHPPTEDMERAARLLKEITTLCQTPEERRTLVGQLMQMRLDADQRWAMVAGHAVELHTLTQDIDTLCAHLGLKQRLIEVLERENARLRAMITHGRPEAWGEDEGAGPTRERVKNRTYTRHVYAPLGDRGATRQMDCQDLCWELLHYDAWVPWVGTYSQGLDMHMAWVDTGNQAMARGTSRLYPDEAGMPCSILAKVMRDGEYRCPQHALYWRLEHEPA